MLLIEDYLHKPRNIICDAGSVVVWCVGPIQWWVDGSIWETTNSPDFLTNSSGQATNSQGQGLIEILD